MYVGSGFTARQSWLEAINWEGIPLKMFGHWPLLVNADLQFDPELNAKFLSEQIALRSGDLWPSPALQDEFLRNLRATTAEGLHAIITLNRAINAGEAEQLERFGLLRQTVLAGPGWDTFGVRPA